MWEMVECEVGVSYIIDKLIPQCLFPVVRKRGLHPLLYLPARPCDIPLVCTWAKVTPHNINGGQWYLSWQMPSCSSLEARCHTAYVQPLAAGAAVPLIWCDGAIYVVTYAVRIYFLDQGGTPIKIRYLGSNFFSRWVLGDLSTYVIRHIDIYGNMTSSLLVLPPQSWSMYLTGPIFRCKSKYLRGC